MSPRRLLALASMILVSIVLAVSAPVGAAGPALIPGKPGGVMNVLTREDLAQGFSIHWPHVKDLLPRHNVHNYGRMQEVWLDR